MSQEETIYEIDDVHLTAAKEWMVRTNCSLNSAFIVIDADIDVEVEVVGLTLFYLVDLLRYSKVSVFNYK